MIKILELNQSPAEIEIKLKFYLLFQICISFYHMGGKIGKLFCTHLDDCECTSIDAYFLSLENIFYYDIWSIIISPFP